MYPFILASVSSLETRRRRSGCRCCQIPRSFLLLAVVELVLETGVEDNLHVLRLVVQVLGAFGRPDEFAVSQIHSVCA